MPALRGITIFDTTLRDGEQSPGAAMSSVDRLRIARELETAGVAVIEAGFPAASLAIAASVAQIAGSLRRAEVAVLARATDADIEAAWDAVKCAQKPRLHTFIATSEIHMEYKLRMSRRAVLAATAHAVRKCRTYPAQVEFSAEDATRSDREFLAEVLSVAIAAGATVINVPDTVGYMQPHEYGVLIRWLRRAVRGIEDVILSVHCHDDLGLATANTLAGVRAGAQQVEVTVNGIGERAGNCALEEVVSALYLRGETYKASVQFDTTRLAELSALVASATRMPVQKNKAIVGQNAFVHEAGIHQDGVLKNRETYEILRAELVGRSAAQLHLGRQSGRHALRARLERLGYGFSEEQLKIAYGEFSKVAADRSEVTEDKLHEIAERCQLGRGLTPDPTLLPTLHSFRMLDILSHDGL